MGYAIVKDGVAERVDAGAIEWDDTHFCTASALSEDERLQFGVVEVAEVPAPAIDQLCQMCAIVGVEFVDGAWRDKWEITQIPVEVIIENKKSLATAAIQAMLDAKAREHRYDSIHTACGWADALPDASALKAWGAACWVRSFELEQEVEAGTRDILTIEELLAEMPQFGA